MVVTFSIILISILASGAWLYQVASIPQTNPLNKDTYESLFPVLTITEDTILTEDYSGDIFIEADGVTLDGNGHTITGPGVWKWNSTMRMWYPSCGIVVEGRTGVTVKNCRVTNFAYGITLSKCDGCTLLNNTVCDNVWGGISVQFSANNTLLENTVYGTRDIAELYDYAGFTVEMSFGNTFKRNVAYDNGIGFSIGEFESDIFEDELGFTPEEYKGNIFEANTAKDNTDAGFWIGGLQNPPPFSNIFFHNNLIGNAIQAGVPPLEYGYPNTWDDGYPSGGNYWSDYAGVDANGDGMGDTPYEIPTVYWEIDEKRDDAFLVSGEPDGKNVDRFPLMAPFSG
jgi:parallel beta-helix repeat protein